jgi:hypothetical protein
LDEDEVLVHKTDIVGPATHAIVIGVGDYPHLLGGEGLTTEFNDGMGQLTSPPESARHFARWLIEDYHNPIAQLATVALLVSDATTDQFENPKTHTQHVVKRAEMSIVDPAVRQWKRRGDVTPDNLLVFFFSGHGMAQGADSSLLLSDYGANEDNVLSGAIDFSTFHLGMARCSAKRQLYFIDACRVGTDTLMESLGNNGMPIISPAASELRDIESPVFYSTLAGAKAFGRQHKPSSFTEMLLKGLEGGGAHDIHEDWRISTTRLKEAIDLYMERAVAAGEKRKQVPPANNLTTFDFHFLQNERPRADVFIGCMPENATALATLNCEPLEVGIEEPKKRNERASSLWQISLKSGSYNFSASFDDNRFRSNVRQSIIRPPLREIRIDVNNNG